MSDKQWARAIILMDMNAFFASIEQRDNEALQNKPVVITNGEQGSCVITSSYEARAFGVKTGMHLREAKQLCPDVIQIPASPKRYIKISQDIMAALHDITPDIEVFSVDEAFLDVTQCQRLHGTPEQMGRMVQQTVWDVSQLHCSVGVSGDKTTAKFAAKLKKPKGFSVIPPEEAAQWLHDVPVTELCGIAKGIGRFLASHGVITCGDMQRLPISVLGKRFGNLGRRIWFMCQGLDPEPLRMEQADPKSMGHGKVMPPRTQNRSTILIYFLHMSEKLAARLRRHKMAAQFFFIGLRSRKWGWIADKIKIAVPTNDGQTIYQLCMTFMTTCWQQEPVDQVQVTALDPKPQEYQQDFFNQTQCFLNREAANEVVDTINNRYGEFCIAPARLLQRSNMPNVIAPAWKPEGHRQTIV